MKRATLLMAATLLAALPVQFAGAADAAGPIGEIANIKVVTDANPDYSDMESMVRSITSSWSTDAQKMYALFYWDHIARRQTAPMILHGFALSDPIRQYNDYGYTMCSTISGIKCSTWNYMGYPCRYWDISNHTVPDVWYEGKFHHYDNSLSMMYTLADGKTIAAVPDVGAPGSGPETDGKEVAGYIALYHAVTGTSPNGFCSGADDARPLSQIVKDFSPKVLKYRYYYYDQDRGHRYILNLKGDETYTRFYSRQDASSPDAVEVGKKSGYKADPAYYVPNESGGRDPEAGNPRYHIRGNGERTFSPVLDAAHLAAEAMIASNIKAMGNSLQGASAGKPAEVIYKIEGANVITSLRVRALITAASANDAASIAVSTTNGLEWADVWKSDSAGMKAGPNPVDLKLIKEVNGSYEVLVKITLNPKGAAADESVADLAFDTITEVNAHTQPQLKLGRNTVYVGAGEQTESIVYWPELQKKNYKPYVFEEKNVTSADENEGYHGTFHQEDKSAPGYVVFKVDAPQDVTSVTYGARLYNRNPKSHIDFLHSFDGGKTWTQSYSLTDTAAPWDVIHYEKVTDIPAGTKSVLFKYQISGGSSVFAIRTEVDHKLAVPANAPLEVTFTWLERQEDYSTVKRSHTQLVEKLPATYTVDVGGFDQPIVESLKVNLKGAQGDVKYGYSDGKDVGGEKFVGKWATYGKDIAAGKTYTYSVAPESKKAAWGAEDPEMKKLTDDRVGSSYSGGPTFVEGPAWKSGKNPEITIDLGSPQKCAAFRIHMQGYPQQDAIKGEVKDKVEVLTSLDGKEYKSAGNFDFRLYWKDIPVNYVWNDEETFKAHNFMLPLAAPVEARYVKYKVANSRTLVITETQVLDSYDFKPFDLKIALPDAGQNGKAPPKADLSPNARKWAKGELPTTIGKEFKRAE